MKVKGFSIHSYGVKVDVSCSNCGTDLASTFSYCPKCGRKLFQIDSKIEYEKVCELITRELQHEASEEKAKNIVIANGAEEDAQVHCPRGKTKSDKCEFLSTDGSCLGVVYPTYPPQYDKCMFLNIGDTAITKGDHNEQQHRKDGNGFKCCQAMY